MLDINIDFQGFVDTIAQEMYMSQEELDTLVDRTMDEVAFQFKNAVQVKAGQELRSTRSDYINGLYSIRLAQGVYEVGLRGFLPNAIESGLSPYDMKEGFAKSSKVKYTKDGSWYLTVPFRHATAGSVATASSFSGVMPEPVQRSAAKAFAEGRKSLKDVDVPRAFREAKRNINSGYVHKSSIYKGMIHSDKTHHGQYTTFRRVSENSEANSWQHPGLDARKLFDKTLSNFPIDEVVENSVRSQI